MINQLKEQIRVVVEARQKAQEAQEAKRLAMLEWEKQNEAIIREALFAEQAVKEAEHRLRELTLEVYAQTGNKAPVKGVGIREVTKLEYDAKAAYNWAVEHKIALKLDTVAFEKMAKVSPPDFVRVFQVAQATIATQLEVID